MGCYLRNLVSLDIYQSESTVQLKGFFSFPPIPVGNKTEWKGLTFLTPL